MNDTLALIGGILIGITMTLMICFFACGDLIEYRVFAKQGYHVSHDKVYKITLDSAKTATHRISNNLRPLR